MTLPAQFHDRLRLPLIAAPMTGVSGPQLVLEACRAGVIGTFPTHNAGAADEFDRWLGQISDTLTEHDKPAPFGVNLVVHKTNARLADDVALLIRHGVEFVITSVGSPVAVLQPLHDAGCLVFADVASMRHVERAIAAGVDGLVLLTAGAGGQTGWANPLSFVRSVRAVFEGPIVLAGGISDGTALWAAEVMGADLAYMGTKFHRHHREPRIQRVPRRARRRLDRRRDTHHRAQRTPGQLPRLVARHSKASNRLAESRFRATPTPQRPRRVERRPRCRRNPPRPNGRRPRRTDRTRVRNSPSPNARKSKTWPT